MLSEYKHIAALLHVIEEQSFEQAAQKLHITQSAVSQRIKQLEDKLGQVLLLRTTPLRATENGQALIRYYRQCCLLETELKKNLKSQKTNQFSQLSIGVNADTLETWLLPTIQPWLEKHKVLLDIKIDDQDETHKLLLQGDVVGCISANPNSPQGCHTFTLGTLAYRCVATPDYIHRYFAEGVTAEAFRQAPVAEFNHKDKLQNQYLNRYFQLEVGDFPCHRIPSSTGFLGLICQHSACGMVPDHQYQPLFNQGILHEVTPGKYLSIPLYWHVWDLKSSILKDLTLLLTSPDKNGLTN